MSTELLRELKQRALVLNTDAKGPLDIEAVPKPIADSLGLPQFEEDRLLTYVLHSWKPRSPSKKVLACYTVVWDFVTM